MMVVMGRPLGYKSDHFVGSDHTMIVNVPMSGAGTLHARTGESIRWLACLRRAGAHGPRVVAAEATRSSR